MLRGRPRCVYPGAAINQMTPYDLFLLVGAICCVIICACLFMDLLNSQSVAEIIISSFLVIICFALSCALVIKFIEKL